MTSNGGSTLDRILEYQDYLLLPLSTVFGAIVCFEVNNSEPFGYPSVLASSITGVLAHALQAPYREAIYTGSFIGMGLHQKDSGPLTVVHVLVGGILAAAAFKLSSAYFVGFGGKLGTIAFFSSLIPVFIGHMAGWAGADYFNENHWDDFELKPGERILEMIGSVVFCTVGALATGGLQRKDPSVGNVTLASSMVGVAGALALFHWKPLAAFVFTGSFVGMSSPAVMPFVHLAIAGAVAGVLLILAWPCFPGIGGKFGFCAFIAVNLVKRISDCRAARAAASPPASAIVPPAASPLVPRNETELAEPSPSQIVESPSLPVPESQTAQQTAPNV